MKNFSIKFPWWTVSLCQVLCLALFLILIQFSTELISTIMNTVGHTLNPLWIMPLMTGGAVYVGFMILAILLGPALMLAAKQEPIMLARNILSLAGWFTLLIFLYIAGLFTFPLLIARFS